MLKLQNMNTFFNKILNITVLSSTTFLFLSTSVFAIDGKRDSSFADDEQLRKVARTEESAASNVKSGNSASIAELVLSNSNNASSLSFPQQEKFVIPNIYSMTADQFADFRSSLRNEFRRRSKKEDFNALCDHINNAFEEIHEIQSLFSSCFSSQTYRKQIVIFSKLLKGQYKECHHIEELFNVISKKVISLTESDNVSTIDATINDAIVNAQSKFSTMLKMIDTESQRRKSGTFSLLPTSILSGVFEYLNMDHSQLETLRTLTGFKNSVELYYQNRSELKLNFEIYRRNKMIEDKLTLGNRNTGSSISDFFVMHSKIKKVYFENSDATWEEVPIDFHCFLLPTFQYLEDLTLCKCDSTKLEPLAQLANLERLEITVEFEYSYKKTDDENNRNKNLEHLNFSYSLDKLNALDITIDDESYKNDTLQKLFEIIGSKNTIKNLTVSQGYVEYLNASSLGKNTALERLELQSYMLCENGNEDLLSSLTNLTSLYLNGSYACSLGGFCAPNLQNIIHLNLNVSIDRSALNTILLCENLQSLNIAYDGEFLHRMEDQYGHYDADWEDDSINESDTNSEDEASAEAENDSDEESEDGSDNESQALSENMYYYGYKTLEKKINESKLNRNIELKINGCLFKFKDKKVEENE